MNRLQLTFLLLAVFLGVSFEATCDFIPRWMGAQVNFLPPLLVYAAVQADVMSVVLIAVCGGLCADALSANLLGVSVPPLLIIGIGLHRLKDLLLRHMGYAQGVLGLMASAAAPVATLLLIWLLGERPLIGWGSLWQWVVVTLLGGALTPPLFFGLDWLQRAFAYQPENVQPFRADREIKRGRS